jgi:hypothetical protein
MDAPTLRFEPKQRTLSRRRARSQSEETTIKYHIWQRFQCSRETLMR